MYGWPSAMAAVLAVGACAPQAVAPTVPVMPAQGKPFDQFANDQATCQAYAQNAIAPLTQQANNNALGRRPADDRRSARRSGAAIGGGRGAAIGAASGAVVGGSMRRRELVLRRRWRSSSNTTCSTPNACRRRATRCPAARRLRPTPRHRRATAPVPAHRFRRRRDRGALFATASPRRGRFDDSSSGLVPAGPF